MILPDQSQQTINLSSSSSSDSSSDDTISDSSHDTISKIIKREPKIQTKAKTTVNKEFVSNGNSFLDHLAPHLSGDAFTTSNLNSLKHPINKFLNVSTETEPEIHQNSPMIIESEHQIPPQITIPEQETLENISEIPQENLHVEPNHEPENSQPQATNEPQITEQCEALNLDNSEHHISSPLIAIETLDDNTPITSNPSSPTSEPFFGPIYKPLTRDELVIPSDLMLPLQESILMHSVEIDETIELLSLYQKIDISKIQIKPLKRKRPKPKIPFYRTQPVISQILNYLINLIRALPNYLKIK
jgi:hypothetical protein